MINLYENQIAQDEQEIAAFVDLLKRENVKSYLEIGSKFGGSLWRVGSSLPTGSRIVSVDLPNGTKLWKETSVSLNACIVRLKGMGHDARVIWGSSFDPKVIEQVAALGPFDAVFIDADHRTPGVTSDWEVYRSLGRLIAFHDINWKRADTWVGTRINVPEFWDSIKGEYRHEEFKFCPSGKNNGIGVLWRN